MPVTFHTFRIKPIVPTRASQASNYQTQTIDLFRKPDEVRFSGRRLLKLEYPEDWVTATVPTPVELSPIAQRSIENQHSELSEEETIDEIKRKTLELLRKHKDDLTGLIRTLREDYGVSVIQGQDTPWVDEVLESSGIYPTTVQLEIPSSPYLAGQQYKQETPKTPQAMQTQLLEDEQHGRPTLFLHSKQPEQSELIAAIFTLMAFQEHLPLYPKNAQARYDVNRALGVIMKDLATISSNFGPNNSAKILICIAGAHPELRALFQQPDHLSALQAQVIVSFALVGFLKEHGEEFNAKVIPPIFKDLTEGVEVLASTEAYQKPQAGRSQPARTGTGRDLVINKNKRFRV